MIKRIAPPAVFDGFPCSQTAVGSALGLFTEAPAGLKPDGYLSLDAMNRYIRSRLPVEKVESFRRGERPTLAEFLKSRDGCYVICVEGHFLYAEGETYWSFFDNDDDLVVRAWHIKEVESDARKRV